MIWRSQQESWTLQVLPTSKAPETNKQDVQKMLVASTLALCRRGGLHLPPQVLRRR